MIEFVIDAYLLEQPTSWNILVAGHETHAEFGPESHKSTIEEFPKHS